MKLNLGCGLDKPPEFVNIDKNTLVRPDIVLDLNVVPWPFGDSQIESIRARFVIEHIDSFIDFFNECHRILKCSAILDVIAVHGQSPNLWTDPTRRRGYSRECFSFLEPETYVAAQSRYTSRKWKVLDHSTDGYCLRITLTPLK